VWLNDGMKNLPLPQNGPGPVSSRIGAILRRHREQQHLSQEATAKAAGLSPMGIHLIETNRRSPKIDTVERICRALKTPIAVIMMEATLES